ncbi:MAG: alkaline phosphatase family protein [Bdellovibrionales bacterium]|nr:alkaline phosphatase family protein [Bdellovibrionales bacterium]
MKKYLLKAMISFFLLWGSLLKAELPTTLFVFHVRGLSNIYFPSQDYPYLSKVRTEGARAGQFLPVFPSLPFPSQTSLATGCQPWQHGIVSDHFIDKTMGEFEASDVTSWLECEPLWVTAERQNVRTGVYQWPMSFRPWKGIEATFHSVASRNRITNKDGFEKLVEWSKLPSDKRPRLIMASLPGIGEEGREFGPLNGKTRQALRKLDRLFEHFEKQIKKISDFGPYAILITSGQGVSRVKEGVVVDSLFQRYWISGVPVVNGPMIFLYLWDTKNASLVAKSLDRIEGLKTYLPRRFPKEFGKYHPRMGDVVGLLESPKVFLRGEMDENRLPNGTYGYRPDDPTMEGFFAVFGHGIKQHVEVPKMQLVDVAPTAAKILGIAPSKSNEGQVQKGFFKP